MSDTGTQTLPRYGKAYLASPWWDELRRAYARHPRAPHACAVCGEPRYQLHHRTYERLGCEHISDLLALCDQHHHALHRAWDHHHRQRPADTLAMFTDAWVIIHRRPFDRANALLPSLALYRPPRMTRNTATSATSTTTPSTTATPAS